MIRFIVHFTVFMIRFYELCSSKTTLHCYSVHCSLLQGFPRFIGQFPWLCNKSIKKESKKTRHTQQRDKNDVQLIDINLLRNLPEHASKSAAFPWVTGKRSRQGQAYLLSGFFPFPVMLLVSYDIRRLHTYLAGCPVWLCGLLTVGLIIFTTQ